MPGSPLKSCSNPATLFIGSQHTVTIHTAAENHHRVGQGKSLTEFRPTLVPPDDSHLITHTHTHTHRHSLVGALHAVQKPIPSKDRTPLGARVDAAIPLQLLEHLPRLACAELARVVVDVQRGAADAVLREDHLQRLLLGTVAGRREDLEFAPVVFFVRGLGALDDDVGPELCDVEGFAGRVEARLRLLPGLAADDEVGRAVGEGDAFVDARVGAVTCGHGGEHRGRGGGYAAEPGLGRVIGLVGGECGSLEAFALSRCDAGGQVA